MIKSSVMNFVRQKAQEGADFADLHAQLKELSAMDLDGEKKKLAKVDADRKNAEDRVRAAQEAFASQQLAHDATVEETKRLKKEGESIIAGANSRAAQIAVDARKAHEGHLAEWDKAVESRRLVLGSLDREVDNVTADLEAKRKEHAELMMKHEALARKHDQLIAQLAAMKSSL